MIDIVGMGTHQALAFDLWSQHDVEDELALRRAAECSRRSLADLELSFTYGEEALIENVLARLRDTGRLQKKYHAGKDQYELCAMVFYGISEIVDLYHEDNQFAAQLRKAAREDVAG